MSAVLLASTATSITRTVRLATGDKLTVIQPQQVPVGPQQLLALAPDPDSITTVMLDVSEEQLPEQRALDLARRFEEQSVAVELVLITAREAELSLPALRVGVRDLLSPEASVEDVRVVLRRSQDSLSRRAGSVAEQGPGAARVISVASPKGGVGKTTVATNLAAALAHGAPQGTVLVDLDIQFGDVAAALDLEPTYTLADMAAQGTSTDLMGLKALLTQHPSGVQVACGVTRPDEADVLTPAAIATLIGTLRQEYRYVVLDTAPGLSESTLAALDQSTDLVLVSGLDVPSVRGLRKELQVLDALDLPPMTQHVVVNMADKVSGLAVSDVEATIGRPVDVTIPRSDKIARSTNAGVPIILAEARDRDAKRFWELAARFAPSTQSSRANGRHRGWLAAR